METLIISLLVTLVVCSIIHELGHVVCARFVGVKVVELGLFYKPTWKYKAKSGITYSLGWLPLGAYTKAAIPFKNKVSWQRAIYSSCGLAATLATGLAFAALFHLMYPTSILLYSFTFFSLASYAVNILPVSPFGSFPGFDGYPIFQWIKKKFKGEDTSLNVKAWLIALCVFLLATTAALAVYLWKLKLSY